MTSLYRSFKNALILAAGLAVFSPIQLVPLAAVAQNLSISYANNYTGAVEVDVYNELGQRIREIDFYSAGGPLSFSWDGLDKDGRVSGLAIYFFHIKVDGAEFKTRGLHYSGEKENFVLAPTGNFYQNVRIAAPDPASLLKGLPQRALSESDIKILAHPLNYSLAAVQAAAGATLYNLMVGNEEKGNLLYRVQTAQNATVKEQLQTQDTSILPAYKRVIVNEGDQNFVFYGGYQDWENVVPTSALKGDFNQDEIVDFVDFFIAADEFGTNNPHFDFDGSGLVDLPDFSDHFFAELGKRRHNIYGVVNPKGLPLVSFIAKQGAGTRDLDVSYLNPHSFLTLPASVEKGYSDLGVHLPPLEENFAVEPFLYLGDYGENVSIEDVFNATPLTFEDMSDEPTSSLLLRHRTAGRDELGVIYDGRFNVFVGYFLKHLDALNDTVAVDTSQILRIGWQFNTLDSEVELTRYPIIDGVTPELDEGIFIAHAVTGPDSSTRQSIVFLTDSPIDTVEAVYSAEVSFDAANFSLGEPLDYTLPELGANIGIVDLLVPPGSGFIGLRYAQGGEIRDVLSVPINGFDSLNPPFEFVSYNIFPTPFAPLFDAEYEISRTLEGGRFVEIRQSESPIDESNFFRSSGLTIIDPDLDGSGRVRFQLRNTSQYIALAIHDGSDVEDIVAEKISVNSGVSLTSFSLTNTAQQTTKIANVFLSADPDSISFGISDEQATRANILNATAHPVAEELRTIGTNRRRRLESLPIGTHFLYVIVYNDEGQIYRFSDEAFTITQTKDQIVIDGQIRDLPIFTSFEGERDSLDVERYHLRTTFIEPNQLGSISFRLFEGDTLPDSVSAENFNEGRLLQVVSSTSSTYDLSVPRNEVVLAAEARNLDGVATDISFLRIAGIDSTEYPIITTFLVENLDTLNHRRIEIQSSSPPDSVVVTETDQAVGSLEGIISALRADVYKQEISADSTTFTLSVLFSQGQRYYSVSLWKSGKPIAFEQRSEEIYEEPRFLNFSAQRREDLPEAIKLVYEKNNNREDSLIFVGGNVSITPNNLEDVRINWGNYSNIFGATPSVLDEINITHVTGLIYRNGEIKNYVAASVGEVVQIPQFEPPIWSGRDPLKLDQFNLHIEGVTNADSLWYLWSVQGENYAAAERISLIDTTFPDLILSLANKDTAGVLTVAAFNGGQVRNRLDVEVAARDERIPDLNSIQVIATANFNIYEIIFDYSDGIPDSVRTRFMSQQPQYNGANSHNLDQALLPEFIADGDTTISRARQIRRFIDGTYYIIGEVWKDGALVDAVWKQEVIKPELLVASFTVSSRGSKITGSYTTNGVTKDSIGLFANTTDLTLSTLDQGTPVTILSDNGASFQAESYFPESTFALVTYRSGLALAIANDAIQVPPVVQLVHATDRSGLGSDIYTVYSDGTDILQLTSTIDDNELNPIWSPDGTKISFWTDRDDNNEIYSMGRDGTNVQRLTLDIADDRNLDWSPDGTKILFTSDRDGNQELYVMNSDGSNVVRLTTDTNKNANGVWSPDGTKIAYTSFDTSDLSTTEIFVVNSDATSPTNLTNSQKEDSSPQWSPDGTKIAFSSERDGNKEIYVMDNTGSNVTRLTNNSNADFEPKWSPDGHKISFLRSDGTDTELLIMDTDGTRQNSIALGDKIGSEVHWSKDSTRLAYTRLDGLKTKIVVRHIDGTGGLNISDVTPHTGNDFGISWSANQKP